MGFSFEKHTLLTIDSCCLALGTFSIRMRSFLFLLLGLTLSASGCGQWRQIRAQNDETPANSMLQAAQMSPDSVVVEISIIRLPVHQLDKFDQFWGSLDVTKVELEQRKNWDRNGLRIATAGNQLPIEIESLLEYEETDPAADQSSSTDETKSASRRRLHARTGKPFRVAPQSVREKLTWFIHEPDGYQHGGTKFMAQPEWLFRAFAKGDGSVRLMAIPEIVYGEAKQVIEASQSSLRFDSRKDSISFGDLRVDVTLGLGESVIIAPSQTGKSDQLRGLGRTFLAPNDGEFKFVVLRIAQTQRDDLFEADMNSQPLESITE